MKLKVKKLHPNAIIPKYATDGSACFDLHAVVEPYDLAPCVMQGVPQSIRTGLSFEIPENHVMLIFSRSGHGFKNGVRLANCTGIIDADYRGEVQVKLTKDDSTTELLHIIQGDRIAQAMIVPIDRVEFEEVEELSSTERGTKGFGSTGQ